MQLNARYLSFISPGQNDNFPLYSSRLPATRSTAYCAATIDIVEHQLPFESQQDGRLLFCENCSGMFGCVRVRPPCHLLDTKEPFCQSAGLQTTSQAPTNRTRYWL